MPLLTNTTALTGVTFTYETWIADYFWTFPRFLDLSLKVLQLKLVGFAGHCFATGLHVPFRADHSIYTFVTTYARNFCGADTTTVRKINHAGCADVITTRYDLQRVITAVCSIVRSFTGRALSLYYAETDSRRLYSMQRACPTIIQLPTPIDQDRQSSQDCR